MPSEENMKKTISFGLVALLSTIAGGAIAAPYGDAVRKQSRCEAAGELAQSFHGATTQDLRDRAKALDGDVKARKITRKFAEETKYILFMGKIAKSEKDAYMEAWAWCMDSR